MSIAGISSGLSYIAQMGGTQANGRAPAASCSGSDDSTSGAPRLSGFAQFMTKIQDLEKSDPDKAKQVLSGIASDLRAEAKEQGGAQADRLNQLADKFDKAADSGDVTGLQPSGGHHHHGGGHGGRVHKAYSQSEPQTSLVDLMNQELDKATATVTPAA